MIVISSKIPIKEIMIPPNKIPLKLRPAVSPNIRNLASSEESPVMYDSLVNIIVIIPAKAIVIRLEKAAICAFLLNPCER